MNITLPKVGDEDPNSLPRGVKAILFDGRVVFVRRVGGRFLPLPEEEQKILKEKHVS